MKTKIIFILAGLFLNRAMAVENVIGHVDNNQIKAVYSCKYDLGVGFTLTEKDNLKAEITSYEGVNFYGDGQLQIVSKLAGFDSLQTTYTMTNNAELVISETVFVGRGGGCRTRAGCGSSDLIKVISANLTLDDQVIHFSCTQL